MKKLIPSLVLGVVSSLLLSVGFVRAAEKCDPLFKPSTVSQVNAAHPSPDCGLPCNLI